jgi:RNA polymerase sigma factor (sigma-70 family)
MEITREVIKIVEGMTKDNDVRQDVYLLCLEADNYEDKNLRNYLSTLVKNCRINGRIQSQNRTRLEEIHAEDISEWAGVNGSADDPLSVMLTLEKEQGMREALSDLEKAVYHLVILRDISYSTAAEHLGITYEALKKHVSRIKSKING